MVMVTAEELAPIFKAAWHAADTMGIRGHRTVAGIRAVLATLDTHDDALADRAAQDAEEVRAASAVAPEPLDFCKDPGPLRYRDGSPIVCVLLGTEHTGDHTDGHGSFWHVDPWADTYGQKVIRTDRQHDAPVPF